MKGWDPLLPPGRPGGAPALAWGWGRPHGFITALAWPWPPRGQRRGQEPCDMSLIGLS